MGSLSIKLGYKQMSLTRRGAKMSLTLNDQTRILFIEIQTLPPSMHQKWKVIFDLVCKNTNGKIIGDQLPTENLLELNVMQNRKEGI